MGYRAKQRILSIKISNGQKTLKELFSLLSHQGNANQNALRFQSEWLKQKTLMTASVGEGVQ